MKKSGMKADQVRELAEQVRLLQNLVKEHFGFGHKNLGLNQENYSFANLFYITESLMNAFLPGTEVKTFVTVSDPLNLKDDVQLPVAAWQRILTNLLKNASEAQCKSFEMVFTFSKTGLSVEARNDFYRLDHQDGELGRGLSKVIENLDQGSQKGPGLGLEAIHLLSLENGGSFNFSIDEGLWYSIVEMKYSDSKPGLENLNYLELHKKAS
jgi:nitrogen fixation/metabolism regulation signal transduction histidine kinase